MVSVLEVVRVLKALVYVGGNMCQWQTDFPNGMTLTRLCNCYCRCLHGADSIEVTAVIGRANQLGSLAYGVVNVCVDGRRWLRYHRHQRTCRVRRRRAILSSSTCLLLSSPSGVVLMSMLNFIGS